jgi:hypothetical protein
LKLLPEGPLNRNNWFMLHKLQYTKRLLLRSRHFLFVTSRTESGGVGLRIRSKLEYFVFRCMWETLLRAFPNLLWLLETAPIILVNAVYVFDNMNNRRQQFPLPRLQHIGRNI